MAVLYPGYAAMISKTNANYRTAINYYKQKEAAFRRALAQGSEDIWSEYITELNKAAADFNKYVLERVSQIIERGNYTAQDQKADGEYAVFIKDLFNSRNRGKGGKAWINMAAAGFTFEEFMQRRCMSAAQAAKVKAYPEQMCQAVYSQWLSSHKEFAATTGVKTYGRVDIAQSAHAITPDTRLELINFIDLEAKPPKGVTQGDFLLQSIAEQNVDQEVFGFQLKTYQGSHNDKRWQNSAVLASMINDLMNNGKTWSSNYAVNYPVYVLSKYIINIVSPTNVMTITPDRVEYISDMLSAYRFYMEVSWDLPGVPKDAETERGGGDEIYPKILNKTVLLRAITAAGGEYKGLAAVGTKLKQSVGYDKTIKVAQIRNVQ